MSAPAFVEGGVVRRGDEFDPLEQAGELFFALLERAREERRGPAAVPAPVVPLGEGAPPQLLLTFKQAAAQLGIGETKLRELEQRRAFRALRIDGAVRIPYSELVDLVARLQREQWSDR